MAGTGPSRGRGFRPVLGAVEIPESRIARFVFGDTRLAVIWLVAQVYVGWQWVTAGQEKLASSAWVGPHAGAALTGFLRGALAQTTGANPAVQGWYAQFLRQVVLAHVVAWSYLVSIGELVLGIALIVGVFTGIAAFVGAFATLNYILAGVVSINPMLFLLELVLILAGRTSGWLGIDFALLPALGTPWTPGRLARPSRRAPTDVIPPAAAGAG
ncbi:MAG TPA: TQO small subunit DoxD [Verrucomicrobiae bacterium]|nr:TQO small subunit DoxD [Verrucomicrobiae bacterium]